MKPEDTEDMSEQESAEPQNDQSFVDSFQAFLRTEEAPQGSMPANEGSMSESESEDTSSQSEKSEDKDPLHELNEAIEDDTELKLPIDEEDEEPEERDEESDKENPYDKGSPQHRRFAEMRKETSGLKTDLESERQARSQLEAKLQEIEAAAARASELEEKIKTYEAKITVTNLQESEAYKEAIQKPLISIIERSDEIADRYGIDRDELADAIEIENETDRRKAFKNITSGLDIDPEDHVEIRALAKELQPLKARKAELLSNADKALAELEATKERSMQEQVLRSAEERKSTVDKVAKHITTKLPFIKTIEGVNFDDLVSNVRETNFDSLDVPNKAYSQIAAQLLPKIIKSNASLMRQVEDLSDDLAKYRKQTPRIGRDMGSPDSGDDDDGLLDRYRKAFS